MNPVKGALVLGEHQQLLSEKTLATQRGITCLVVLKIKIPRSSELECQTFPFAGNENIGSFQIPFMPLSRGAVQVLNSTVLPPYLPEQKLS